jgi:REP element-mobilizing transposase RayT
MRIHVIFSTKERQNRLREDFQPKLWAYIAGIARNHGFEAIEIGGVENHCHALILLPRIDAALKGSSISEGLLLQVAERHRSGGGGIRLAGRLRRIQRERITDGWGRRIHKNQLEHHKKRNYEEEFLELLKRYGIAYDPAHVLG